MTKLGTHGYDNRLKEMRPIFMAIGPALKRNVTTPEDFSIVDIYSLMCRVLQIQPAPNNGSSVRVEQLLSSSASGLHPLLFARNFFGSNSTSQTVFIGMMVFVLLHYPLFFTNSFVAY